jgi:hypothetical protein
MFAVGDRVKLNAELFGNMNGWQGVITAEGYTREWLVVLDDNKGGSIEANSGELAKVEVVVLEGVCDEMLKSRVWYQMNEFPNERLCITIERVKEG